MLDTIEPCIGSECCSHDFSCLIEAAAAGNTAARVVHYISAMSLGRDESPEERHPYRWPRPWVYASFHSIISARHGGPERLGLGTAPEHPTAAPHGVLTDLPVHAAPLKRIDRAPCRPWTDLGRILLKQPRVQMLCAENEPAFCHAHSPPAPATAWTRHPGLFSADPSPYGGTHDRLRPFGLPKSTSGYQGVPIGNWSDRADQWRGFPKPSCGETRHFVPAQATLDSCHRERTFKIPGG